MTRLVALKGHYHTCPMVTGTVPHVGGAIIDGHDGLTVNTVPVALQGDRCQCQAGGPDAIIEGHNALTVEGIPVVTQGSVTAHGGVIIEGDGSLTID